MKSDSDLARRLFICLIGLDLLLVAAYVVATFVVWPGRILYRLVNLDAEASLAAWSSASQLLLCGIAFASIASKERNSRFARSVFMLTAAGFVFLSADEAAAIHETITAMGTTLGYRRLSFGGHGIWIPLYLGAGLIFAVATQRIWVSLWSEHRSAARLLLAGCVALLLGAVVVEFLSYGALRGPDLTAFYRLQVAVEEALELVGVTLMLAGSVRLHAEHG